MQLTNAFEERQKQP